MWPHLFSLSQPPLAPPTRTQIHNCTIPKPEPTGSDWSGSARRSSLEDPAAEDVLVTKEPCGYNKEQPHSWLFEQVAAAEDNRETKKILSRWKACRPLSAIRCSCSIFSAGSLTQTLGE